ncbi:MAG: succinate dehydrogenase, cytochrome b556 subunit [Gammaproteobacteria bacterium]|nr:succinate dehydrogenase, cytochrome b556 subunit [Gammaproteobacteria bacterium]
MVQRPLSPHLTVYRPLIGSFTSILHRGMNCLLLFGALVLALWVLSAAIGGGCYDSVTAVLASWFGQLALFAWTFAAYYFVCQWIRHFAWDLGYGFELAVARRTGWLVLIGASVMTLVTWVYLIARSGA